MACLGCDGRAGVFIFDDVGVFGKAVSLRLIVGVLPSGSDPKQSFMTCP